MQVIIQPDTASAANLVARLVADTLKAKPAAVLGLATGRTMEPVYERLIEFHRNDGLDFSRCSTFNLDEYAGVTADDTRSYRHTMQQLLFDHVNVRPEATHLPDGMAADLNEACVEYENKINAAGGIDLQLLGIGSNGHIGFNEPLSSFSSPTHVEFLTADTIRQNAGLCGGEDRVPRFALTMGVATILASRRALMLVTGGAKAELLANFIEGPVTAMITASALHWHQDCIIVADADAASVLKNRERFQFAFENNPAWEAYR